LNHLVATVLNRPLLPDSIRVAHPRRLLVAMTLMLAASWPGPLGEITRSMIHDAYVQVSVFVAATLLIFYSSEKLFGFNIGRYLRDARLMQVPLAAVLGATPGCGGAIVVVAAYTSGNVGFGAVVATLTATMGDAAFLLIAIRPDAAAVILPLSLVVGTISGMIVDRFCRPPTRAATKMDLYQCTHIGKLRHRDIIYCAIAVVSLPAGILLLTGLEIPDPFDKIISMLAMIGVACGMLIWIQSPVTTMTNPDDHPVTRSAEETGFITAWVIVAFLSYEYAVEFSGLNLEALFATIAPLIPLAGIVIGLIPGCGPQVLVTTLYINGVIPFAALVGNAISNDGDALFPAIALDPRAAVLATLYSTIPALIVAYAFYFLAPGFMN